MLLADFHIHTTWSDGRLPIPEIVDLFGRTGHDVIAITDHVVNEDSLLGKDRPLLRLSVTTEIWDAYRSEIERETSRAWDAYRMVVLPGVELTRNALTGDVRARPRPGPRPVRLRGRTGGGDATRARDAGAVTVACHPHEQSDWFANTFYLWNRRREVAGLVDLWELACRWDLFPPVSRARLPYLGNSDFHDRPHLWAWKTLIECEKTPEAVVATLRSGLGLGVTRLLDPSRSRRATPSETRPHVPCTVIPGLRGAGDRVRPRMTLTLVLLALAAAGGLVTTLQTGLVLRFLTRKRPFAPGPRERAASASRPAASTGTPRVSILKPLSGLDDGLEENLASFGTLAGVSYEVILSAARADDPAVAVAGRVIRRFPGTAFRLVVGRRDRARPREPEGGPPRRRRARGARRDPPRLGLERPRGARRRRADRGGVRRPDVGCVSSLFTGARARTFGAVVESLHLLTFVVPGASSPPSEASRASSASRWRSPAGRSTPSAASPPSSTSSPRTRRSAARSRPRASGSCSARSSSATSRRTARSGAPSRARRAGARSATRSRSSPTRASSC